MQVKTIDEPSIISGCTVERAGPKVGRNDPCPCGSGRKYKKCCMQNARAPEPAPLARRFSRHQIALMSTEEIGALDFDQLQEDALRLALHRLMIAAWWPEAERAFAALERIGVEDLDEERLDMIHWALTAQDLEVAERAVARLANPELLTPQLQIGLVIARSPPDVLDQIEALLAETLDDRYDPGAISLAYSLAYRHPALAIAVARGALTPYRPLDSEGLLEEIEAARARLDLEPGDPWWDVFDAWASADDSEPVVESVRPGRQRSADDAAAREERRRLDAELAEKREELRRLKRRLTRAEPADQQIPRTPGETELLHRKIEELKGLIEEGKAERRTLRAALSERARHREAPAEAASEADELEGEAAPERWSIPTFSDAAQRDLEHLPAQVARLAIKLAGAIASSDPSGWRQVKKLERGDGVRSARIGIHHRMLFRMGSGSMEVLRVIARAELDRF